MQDIKTNVAINDNIALKRKCKVYDVEKKQLIREFESICEASKFLGINPGGIAQYIKSKCRCHTNKLGITVAIR